MTSPTAAAVTAAFQATQAARGEAVTYDDGTTSGAITAVRGQTTWEPRQSPVDGAWIEERSTDWLILAEDLSDADIDMPAIGHTITDGTSQEFIVLPFGSAELVYRWHDRGRTVYRIFTKERAT